MPRKRRIPERKKKPNSRKTGVSGVRFRTDPAFKQSRRAMHQFGPGPRPTLLLREAFSPMTKNIPQIHAHRQLTRSITTLIREKKAAGPQRVRLNQLQWENIKRFEFNGEQNLQALLCSKYSISVQPG